MKLTFLLLVVLSVATIGCETEDIPNRNSKADPCIAEIDQMKQLAYSTLSLAPPVTMRRLTWCMCGHLEVDFVDSNQRELELNICSRIASLMVGYPEATVLTFGDCHSREEAIPLSPDEDLAAQALMGIWLTDTFSNEELYAIASQPSACTRDYFDTSAHAQVLLSVAWSDPNRFRILNKFIDCDGEAPVAASA